MNYYQKHVFFCCNQKPAGKKCCNNADATEISQYAKEKLAKLGLSGKGKTRISRSACLGRCTDGPAIVIYPEQTWYTYQNKADIDEIIEKHLVEGRIVERLVIAE